MNLAEQYIDDVVNGRIVVCDLVKKTIDRHLNDLETAQDRGFYFDEEEGSLAIQLFKMFKHTKGREFAGAPFRLTGYQAFQLWCLFGWKVIDSGFRRFLSAYIETAKKSGKSEFAAGLLLMGLLFDNEYGSQCYTYATKRDQALHVFRPAKVMAKFLRNDSKQMRKLIKIYKHQIAIEETESFLAPLSADYDSLDGVDTHFGICDEYHAHKNSLLNDNIQNSMVARAQPMNFIITTAGFNLNGPCYALRKTAIDVLNGIKEDDRFFVMIFTLDDEDDWNDPDCWVKANPNLGNTPKMENLMAQYTKAKNEGRTKEVDFKTKNLNLWVASEDTWISDDTWMLGAGEIPKSELINKKRKCFGGLDLGQTRDLTALTLVFPPDDEDGIFEIMVWFWCCQDTATQRQENGDPYLDWAHQGFMEITPGNVTDYGYVKRKIVELAGVFDIQSIGYDPANSTQLVIELLDEGLNMRKFSQGIMNMNAPTRELEELVYKEQIRHGGNPILRWMCSNVDIVRDSSGNIKISKKEELKKVDGMVALVMSIGEYMDYKGSPKNPYEKRGLFVIGD